MWRSLGSPHRRAIPKTSYSSRRASSNSLLSMGMGRGQGQDRKPSLGYDGGGAGGLSGSHSGGYQTLRGGVQRSPRVSQGGIGRCIYIQTIPQACHAVLCCAFLSVIIMSLLAHFTVHAIAPVIANTWNLHQLICVSCCPCRSEYLLFLSVLTSPTEEAE